MGGVWSAYRAAHADPGRGGCAGDRDAKGAGRRCVRLGQSTSPITAGAGAVRMGLDALFHRPGLDPAAHLCRRRPHPHRRGRLGDRVAVPAGPFRARGERGARRVAGPAALAGDGRSRGAPSAGRCATRSCGTATPSHRCERSSATTSTSCAGPGGRTGRPPIGWPTWCGSGPRCPSSSSKPRVGPTSLGEPRRRRTRSSPS